MEIFSCACVASHSTVAMGEALAELLARILLVVSVFAVSEVAAGGVFDGFLVLEIRKNHSQDR